MLLSKIDLEVKNRQQEKLPLEPMEKPGEVAARIMDFLTDCRACRQTGDRK